MRSRKRNRILIIAILIMLIGILTEFLFIRYQASNEIGVFNRKPTITLTGDETVTLYPGDTYEEPGYLAENYEGEDITRKLEVTLPDGIDESGRIAQSGDYEITYTVKDHGRTATATRKIEFAYHEPDETSEDYGHSLAILMYHNVYDPEDLTITTNSNYISTLDLEAHLMYLVDTGYYFPTWKEVRDYIDGTIDLPKQSIVLTFDDGAENFLQYGIPLLEEYDVRATLFLIGTKNADEVIQNYSDTKHLSFQSHSYDMHKGGGDIGHGGIMTSYTVEESLADLEQSIQQLGSGEAFAYPFGDTNETAVEAVRQAGFYCAVTTVNGLVYPRESDPLLLSRIRISRGNDASTLAGMIEGPDIPRETSHQIYNLYNGITEEDPEESLTEEQ